MAQLEGKNKVEAARIVGRVVAERAKNAGITSVILIRWLQVSWSGGGAG
ncbi:MAG: hypothetical protein U0694_25770 [Anaerolineae bacterium]